MEEETIANSQGNHLVFGTIQSNEKRYQVFDDGQVEEMIKIPAIPVPTQQQNTTVTIYNPVRKQMSRRPFRR